ncbi:MAG: pyridoxal-dependent decarboxylase [Myxococcota bacterium]|nr:pyridoxal-dependent decarboxylase [Myxococcota bacterium]
METRTPAPIDPALLADATQRAVAYLDALPARPVRAEPDAVAKLRYALDAPLPEAGRGARDVLAELDALGSPATVASAGPRYFGFVTGGSLPATVAAGVLASAWDQNAFSHASSPAGALFEEVSVRWLAELFGLPASCGGALVSGATLANFSALAAARHALLARAGWDVEADGLFGAPQIPVYVSDEFHASVRKALGLVGFGRDRVHRLATDAQGRIRTDALPPLAEPALVCAQAGNVNSGASDPFEALRDWCDRSGSWLHVDGAFGLFAATVPRLRSLVAGVERADSWAADAHKWLNVPYECGVVLVRDAMALRDAMTVDAAYLTVDAPREPFHYGPELSRRARGVEVWAALRSLGRAGVAALVDRCCRQARRFAEGLRAAGHDVRNEVALNQVVVSFGDAAKTARVIERVQREGVCWAGPTTWRGAAGMRISVSGWATSDADVERSLASILRCAAAER